MCVGYDTLRREGLLGWQHHCLDRTVRNLPYLALGCSVFVLSLSFSLSLSPFSFNVLALESNHNRFSPEKNEHFLCAAEIAGFIIYLSYIES